MSAPVNRRAALTGALATIPALAGAAAASTPSLASANPDAEILALSAEIIAEREKARAMYRRRVEPFEKEFLAIMAGRPFVAAVRRAFAFSHECGREAAVEEIIGVLEGADDLFKNQSRAERACGRRNGFDIDSHGKGAAGSFLAAVTIGRTETALGAFYRRLSARIGKSKAVTATARKIAVLFYNAMRHGMQYVDPGASAYEERYKARVIKGLQRRAKALGFALQPVREAPTMAVS
jgi:hypothetical protein